MSTLIQPAPISAVRRQFIKSNDTFGLHAAVFETISDRLLSRLELLAIKPTRVLDLGCRTGYQLEALAQRYPEASIVGADPAPGRPAKLQGNWPKWLRRTRPESPARIACDPHSLPFADGSFDLVVSNLLLPWCHSPHQVFSEAARVLGKGGVIMFTSAGPDTLIEYRKAWTTIDAHLHGFGLLDMHDVGDTMMAAGFAAPVLDRDNLVVDYPDIEALQLELRSLGAGNLATGRRKGLMAKEVNSRLNSAVPSSSRFPVTLELVQGHGWKGELKSSGDTSGDFTISVDSLRGSWSQKMGRRR